jgi:hypothetical protein
MQGKSRQRKIVIRLYGGLGNQIFQYLFGMLLSSKDLAEVYFDKNWLNNQPSHSGSDLRNFKFTEEAMFVRERGTFAIKCDELLTRLARVIKPLSKISKIKFECSLEDLNYDLTKKYSRFRGYYQDLNYPENLIGELRSMDWDLNCYSESFTNILGDLQSKKFIALHVRGGDYLSFGSIHENLGTDYYEKSLKYITKELPEASILIFTDDRLHAQEVLPANEKFQYVSDLSLSISEEFLLMSKASAHIIANSTFSYWSAQLSRTSSFFVCPRAWYRAPGGARPIYPINWVVI